MSNTIIFGTTAAWIMSRCDFENSQISPQGVAGDDIMYPILVILIVDYVGLQMKQQNARIGLNGVMLCHGERNIGSMWK